MVYVIVFILGIAVGASIASAIGYRKPAGTLKMDRSTGDPYLFLELKVPIDEVLQMDTVIFDVDHTRQ